MTVTNGWRWMVTHAFSEDMWKHPNESPWIAAHAEQRNTLSVKHFSPSITCMNLQTLIRLMSLWLTGNIKYATVSHQENKSNCATFGFLAVDGCGIIKMQIYNQFLLAPLGSLLTTRHFCHRTAAYWVFFFLLFVCFLTILCKWYRMLCMKIPHLWFLKYLSPPAWHQQPS